MKHSLSILILLIVNSSFGITLRAPFPTSFDVVSPVDYIVEFEGGSAPYNIDYIDYHLPAGLNLTEDLRLHGTPVGSSDDDYYSIYLAIYDANGHYQYFYYELNVNDDLDDDGLNDKWEQAIVEYVPNDAITSVFDVNRNDNFDQDDFTNIEEYILGFDPLIPDGNKPDTLQEGLLLVSQIQDEDDIDSVYFDLIYDCFDTVLKNEPHNVSALVFKSIARLFTTVNHESLRLLINDFGYQLTETFKSSGTFDFENAPTINAATETAIGKLIDNIDASIVEIKTIPAVWKGYVEISPTYFSVDETIYLDPADLDLIEGAMELFKSYLLSLLSYNLNVDYSTFLTPHSVPHKSISVDGRINDWYEIDSQLFGTSEGLIDDVKVAQASDHIYLLVQLREEVTKIDLLEIDFSLGENKAGELQINSWWQTNYYLEVDGAEHETYEIQFVNTNHLIEIAIPKIDTSITNISIQEVDLIINNWTEWDMLEFLSDSNYEHILSGYSDLLKNVENTNYLNESKLALLRGIDLIQAADQQIIGRTDQFMHLVEYDLATHSDRQEVLSRLQEIETSLISTNTIVVNVDNENHLNDSVYLGAFFEGPYVDRTLLPGFNSKFSRPDLTSFPDPTFGGILPNWTQTTVDSKITRYDLLTDIEEIRIIIPNSISESDEIALECIAILGNGVHSNITSDSTFQVDSSFAEIMNGNILVTEQVDYNRTILVSVMHKRFQDSKLALINDVPLSEGVDNNFLNWVSGGSKNSDGIELGWLFDGTTSIDGKGSIKSGNISDAEYSWFETTISGTGTLSFYSKLSSEERFDWLWFLVNNDIRYISSGERDWSQVIIELSTAGPHLLRWEYFKDKSLSQGADSAWIDKIVWNPNTEGYEAWASSLNIQGGASSFYADSDGDGIMNGIEYAFGEDAFWIKIITTNGPPYVELPIMENSRSAFIDMEIKASTDLNNWTTELQDISTTKSTERHRPVGNPDRAFFRMEISLKP